MTSFEQSDPATVFQLVEERIGLSPQSMRGERSAHGVLAAMKRAGFSESAPYVAHLRSHPVAFEDLICELTAGETYFFRDQSHFTFIEEVALPALRTVRQSQHVFHAWSAGCASGEEAYSLAIMLEEHGLATRSRVFGTDVSRRALDAAQRATYGTWALRGVQTRIVEHYFNKMGKDRHRLDPRLVQRVTFALHNLTSGYPAQFPAPPAFDFVFCRNVLIYLTADATRRVTTMLSRSLAEGGFLITGPSDPLLAFGNECETIRTKVGLFYRKRSAAEMAGRVPSPLDANAAACSPGAHHTSCAPLGPAIEVEREGLLPEKALAFVAASAVEDLRDEAALAVTEVQRVSASHGSLVAEGLCRESLRRHALSPWLHYLHAALLFDLRRMDDAEASVRRVLYLDDSLAIAHLLHALIARARGDLVQAQRSYHRVWKLCSALPPEALVPFADGLSNGVLTQLAGREESALKESARLR